MITSVGRPYATRWILFRKCWHHSRACDGAFNLICLETRGARNFGLGVLRNRNMEYAERRILGYSMEQMYDVVADIKKYKEFVPWCTNSTLVYGREGSPGGNEKYQMEIGFPPISERYNSNVTFVRPNMCKAVSTEGKLFNHLVTEWKFSPGVKDNENTCTLDFFVSFEFRNILYTKLSKIFSLTKW